MNPMELRYKIFTLLSRANERDGSVFDRMELVPPVNGEPLTIALESPDPYSKPGAIRKYRVTVEEV